MFHGYVKLPEGIYICVCVCLCVHLCSSYIRIYTCDHVCDLKPFFCACKASDFFFQCSWLIIADFFDAQQTIYQLWLGTCKTQLAVDSSWLLSPSSP